MVNIMICRIFNPDPPPLRLTVDFIVPVKDGFQVDSKSENLKKERIKSSKDAERERRLNMDTFEPVG
tara:strand:- start:745 stop:945 length:201 start_codon:yes stop_codon:yes gene_type:complete